MKKNTFILTTGLSGSSVMTGLITKAGFWCGDKTEFKDNGTGQYETYENSQFVALNNRLVELSNKTFDSKSWYAESLRDEFTGLISTIDLTDFKQFVSNCTSHEPWVLKDPKLWITIGFWLELFKTQDIHVVILMRDVKQLWFSQTTKRIIYDYHYLKNAERKSKSILIDFFKSKKIDYLELEYEQFIKFKNDHLTLLNKFLKTKLTLTDWNAIYSPKKKKLIPLLNEMKAILIYIKNYSLRIR